MGRGVNMILEIIKGNRYGEKVMCSCDYCNHEFIRPKANVKSMQFCSKKCFDDYQRIDKRKKKKETQSCGCGCGEEMPKYGAQLKRITYIRGHNRRGKYSNFWKGGKVKYSRDTSPERTKWKKKILIRDDYTCHVCKKRGGKLHIHHIYPFHIYPEFNHKVWNGLVLCPKCHMGIESVIKTLYFRRGEISNGGANLQDLG